MFDASATALQHGVTALQMGVPGSAEMVVILIMGLLFLVLPLAAVGAVVYFLVERNKSDEVERLENRVEELEAKLDEE